LFGQPRQSPARIHFRPHADKTERAYEQMVKKANPLQFNKDKAVEMPLPWDPVPKILEM